MSKYKFRIICPKPDLLIKLLYSSYLVPSGAIYSVLVILSGIAGPVLLVLVTMLVTVPVTIISVGSIIFSNTNRSNIKNALYF